MKQQQTGFTLIELIIVIVLLGILAAVAVPRFVDLSGPANAAAIDGGEGGLKAARIIYIAENRTNPNVTQLAAAMDPPATAVIVGTDAVIQISGITYDYKAYTNGACSTAATALADIVACVQK